MKIVLASSNQNKLEEFREYGIPNLELLNGQDLPEIKGNSDQVIIYKSLEAGKSCPYRIIVEDTILKINGLEMVDIRWKMDYLKHLDGSPTDWIVNLGDNNQKTIRVYTGIINCRIKLIKTLPDDAFGFDPFLVPNGQELSLYELKKLKYKQNFSARKQAVDKWLKQDFNFEIDIKNIPSWNGEMQNH